MVEEGGGSFGEGLPVCREMLVSHHELEVVDDHVGDIIHVDGMLHGVNYRPGQGKTGISPGDQWRQGWGC